MFDSIESAIEDIKRGKLVVVADDEDRENEGDFVTAAGNITPEVINFMSKHGRGLICAALPEERCDELGLELMESIGVERIHERVDHAYATDRYGGDIDDAAVRLMHDKFVAVANLPFEVLDSSALRADQTLKACRAMFAAGRLRIDPQTVEALDT